MVMDGLLLGVAIRIDRRCPGIREKANTEDHGRSFNAYDEFRGELQTPPILYSEFVQEDSRLQTFTGTWNPALDSREFAAAGFFYTGDQLVCFWCGHGLKNWTTSDDPWYCHLRLSPDCGFLAFALREVERNAYKERIRAEQTTLQCLPDKQEAQQGNEPRQRYTTFKTRVLTFSKWTKPTPTPQKLAEAGFYYTGESDIVRCFHCHVGLGDWNDGEDPWIEHAKLFPCCGFVIRNTGFNFIQSVQNDLQNEGVAAAQVPEIERAIQTPTNDETLETSPFNYGDFASVSNFVEWFGPLPRPCGLPAPSSSSQDEVPMRESDNPIYSQDAQAVINLGFSKAAVFMAIEELNSEGIIWNANDLVEWLLEKQHRCEPQECLQRRPLSNDFIRDDLPETSEETVRQINILKTRTTCYRCKVREANILFLPCAHVRACQECSVDANVCFLCKEEIKDKIKTYR